MQCAFHLADSDLYSNKMAFCWDRPTKERKGKALYSVIYTMHSDLF